MSVGALAAILRGQVPVRAQPGDAGRFPAASCLAGRICSRSCGLTRRAGSSATAVASSCVHSRSQEDPASPREGSQRRGRARLRSPPAAGEAPRTERFFDAAGSHHTPG